MDQIIQKSLPQFFVAGISYEKANSAIRGQYAVDEKAYRSILRKACAAQIPELFILSTCNRTEIYGFAPSAGVLIELLCSEMKGDPALFSRLASVESGQDAVRHLYRVAAGLESQILGDYEIISQVKAAARFAKENGGLGTFTERLVNSVLQVSKQIKNETRLSSGTVSVAFAAVQYLKEIEGITDSNIVLLGTGKIGRNTCKNLMSYFGDARITLINRTEASAAALAASLGLRHAPYEQLSEHLNAADIVLVATNAPRPTVRKSHFTRQGRRILIDLSVPRNVAEDVKALPGMQVVDVDELSRVQDQTLALRRQEIPRAAAIIDEQMQDFLYWYQMRKHAVVLQAVRKKIEEIHDREIKNQKNAGPFGREDLDEVSGRIIQKMVNVFAGKLRHANGHAENYLQMLGEIFEIPGE
jgi:glutamyl-tRNA reductase